MVGPDKLATALWFLQQPAQAGNVLRQVVIFNDLARPDALAQLVLGHHAAWFSTSVGVRVYGLKPGSDILFDWSEVNMKNTCAAMFVMDGFQYHSPDMKLRPDWQKFQGSPATHFRMAKDAGFDFYAVTDHSQEAAFSPLGPNSPQWLLTKQQAEAATSKDFVAIAGFEYSETMAPVGRGTSMFSIRTM